MSDLLRLQPSSVEIDMFLKKHGNRGSKVLSMLGYNKRFIHAVTSDIGRELLKDIMNEMDRILALVIELKAKEKDLAEYRCYRHIFNKWIGVIAKYNQSIDKIKEDVRNAN